MRTCAPCRARPWAGGEASRGRRSGGGDSSAAQRVVSQLLTEMDGITPLNQATPPHTTTTLTMPCLLRDRRESPCYRRARMRFSARSSRPPSRSRCDTP